MFYYLNAAMASKKMSLKALAEQTGIGYVSLKNKMSGVTEFKRNEMILIKSEFPNCSLDYLFTADQPVGKEG